MSFPICSPESSAGLAEALFALGQRWAGDKRRPRIEPDTLDAWDRLIDTWTADQSLPLLVRKARNNRGSVIAGKTGRALVPTDNSPAQWAFAIAHDGECPRRRDLTSLLSGGQLPIAMALSGLEKGTATYRGIRGKCPGTSDAGWKLAHIQPVALGGRGTIAEHDPVAIERHFRPFMSPRNMLVVPSGWAGLAEVPEFVRGFQTVVQSE
jgi:hypothetical protein